MSPEIENLIKIIKEGGAISDRQKEIILNKAKTLGEDLSEVELVLENIPILDVSNSGVYGSGERRKCPNCGAIIIDETFTCPECGYVFQKEHEASEDARKCIQLLQEKLEKASVPATKYESVVAPTSIIDRQIAIISSFSIPSTKEGLLQLLEFSYSNYNSIGTSFYDKHMTPLRNAWLGKALQAYRTLRRFAESDPDIQKILNDYPQLEKQTNTLKKPILSSKIIPSPEKVVKKGCGYFVVIIFIVAAVIAERNNSSQDAEIKKQVIEEVRNGNFEDAELMTKGVNYSSTRDDLYLIIYEAEFNSLLRKKQFKEAKKVLDRVSSESSYIFEDLEEKLQKELLTEQLDK